MSSAYCYSRAKVEETRLRPCLSHPWSVTGTDGEAASWHPEKDAPFVRKESNCASTKPQALKLQVSNYTYMRRFSMRWMHLLCLNENGLVHVFDDQIAPHVGQVQFE